MIDPLKLQLSARNSSLKIWQQGSGTLNVPSGSSTPGGDERTEATVTISHGYGSDNLIVQVAQGDFLGGAPGWLLPQVNPPGTIWIFAHLDSSNLYVTGGENRPFPVPADGYSVSFSYRLLIP